MERLWLGCFGEFGARADWRNILLQLVLASFPDELQVLLLKLVNDFVFLLFRMHSIFIIITQISKWPASLLHGITI